MTTEIDRDKLDKFNFKVWTYKKGEMVSVMITIGDRLGLYKAMQGEGPLSSADLATRTGLNERFVREWLLGQAAAGLIDTDDDATHFELSPEQAAVLADEERSISFAAGAFRGGFSPETVEAILESFRSGIGITYEQQGEDRAEGLARMTAPTSRHALTSDILPSLDGVHEKLQQGATVVDVGCGAGVTLVTIAAAYPQSRCIGYDPSSTAVRLAQQRANEEGVTNVEFVAAGAEDLPADLNADLILTFDCMHDMAFPDVAARAIRQTIADDGTWLLKDIRSTGSFRKDMRNPLLAMFYGFSLTSCLQSAMSEPGGMGLGTLGLHAQAAEQLVTEAGFGSFTAHDFNDKANLYYEVRVGEPVT